jgi:hypothetical protein
MTHSIYNSLSVPINFISNKIDNTTQKFHHLTKRLTEEAFRIKNFITRYFNDIQTVSLLFGTVYCAQKHPTVFGITAFVSFIGFISGRDDKNLETGITAIEGDSILERMKDSFSSIMKLIPLITIVALPTLRGAVAGVIAGDFFARWTSDYISNISSEELEARRLQVIEELRTIDES